MSNKFLVASIGIPFVAGMLTATLIPVGTPLPFVLLAGAVAGGASTALFRFLYEKMTR